VTRYTENLQGVDIIIQTLRREVSSGGVRTYRRLGFTGINSDTGSSWDPWMAVDRGTDAERAAISTASGWAYDGLRFFTTDTQLNWIHTGGAWRLVPGQVLASMVGPAANTGGANTLIGSVISTPVLPAG